MKKILTMAVTALAGLWGLTASATAFQDGHCYKLRNVSFPQFYMNIEQATGANAIADETASIIYAIQKTDDPTRWQFRANNATGALLSANSWNAVCNSSDTEHFWLVEETEQSSEGNSIVKFKNDWATYPGYIGLDYQTKAPNAQSTPADNFDKKLYGNGSYNQTWEVIEVPMPHYVNYTIKLGDTTISTFSETVEAGAKYSTATPPAGVTFSEQINNAELTTDKNITVTITADNEHLFKLVSARYPGNWIKSSISSLTANGNSFAAGEWLLEVPESDNSGNFKMWVVNQARYVGSIPSSGSVALTTTNPGTFKLIFNANGAEAITNSTDTRGVDGDFFNHQNPIGRWHAKNDAGSYWFMAFDETAWNTNKLSFCYQQAEDGTKSVPSRTDNNGPFNTAYTYPYQAAMTPAVAKLDELKALTVTLTTEQATAKANLAKAVSDAQVARFGVKGVNIPNLLTAIETAMTAVEAAFNEYYVSSCSYIARADEFAALGIASADGLAAWNTYKTAFYAANASAMTETNVTETVEAYTALVASSSNTAGGAHIKLSPKVAPAQYLCIGNDIEEDHGLSFYRAPAPTSDGKSIWTLKAATGGFYLYNEYANAYAKFPAGSEAMNNGDTRVRPVAEDEASLFVFELQDATAGRVGIKYVGTDISVDNSRNYFHTNGGSRVVRWATGPESSWFISASDADAAADEYVSGAMHNSEGITESSDVVGFWFNDVTAINTARAIAEPTTTADKRTKGDAIYAAMAKGGINQPTNGEIYTIINSEVDARGSIYYKEGELYVWATAKNAMPEGSDADQWLVVKKGNETYLYNVAAKQFANANGDKGGSDASGVDHAWLFSNVPTAVTFGTTAYTMPTDGTSLPFTIEGGPTNTKNRPGMMIIKNLDTPVPAVAGYSSATDGAGFRFTKVGEADADLLAEVDKVFGSSTSATAEADVTEAEALIADYEVDTHSNVIGHYTAEAVEAFNAAIAAAKAETDPQAKAAKIAVAERTLSNSRVAAENKAVYTLTTSENKHYAVIGGKQKYTEEAAEEGANTHFWQANVEGNVVSFTHTYKHDDSSTAVEVTLEHNGATQFNIEFGEPGVVSLKPVEPQAANKPAMRKVQGQNNDLTFVITKAPGAQATTAIDELSTINHQLSPVYDLQGRKLAAPIKGINIIGGRKVLVK